MRECDCGNEYSGNHLPDCAVMLCSDAGRASALEDRLAILTAERDRLAADCNRLLADCDALRRASAEAGAHEREAMAEVERLRGILERCNLSTGDVPASKADMVLFVNDDGRDMPVEAAARAAHYAEEHRE